MKTCPICNSNFQYPWMLKRHLQRKNRCKPVNNLGVSQNVSNFGSNVSRNVNNFHGLVSRNVNNVTSNNSLPNNPSNFNNTNNPTNPINLPTNPINTPTNPTNPINPPTNPINTPTNHIVPTIYRCNYCDKDYKHRQSLYYHRLKCPHYIKEKEIREELSISRTELTRLKDKLFHKTVSNKKNKKAIKKIINNINNTNNNNTTNNTTNNNIQINNHIHINPLGKEDLSFITSKDKRRILKCKYDGIIELTKLIYSKPENMNFYKPNKKEDVMAYINEKGQLQHGNYSIVSNDIINSNMNRFDIMYEKEGNNLNENTKRQLNNVINDNDRNRTLPRYQNQFDLYVMDSNKTHKRQIEQVYSISDQDGELGTVIVLKD